MLSTLTSYRLIAANLPAAQAQVAKEPLNARETAYYKSKIGSITTVDAFLNNARVFSYAMTAFGLQDMTYAKGFMRKVLTGGVSDSKSFANTLTDPRFRAFASAFPFNTKGQATDLLSGNVTQVVSQYTEQQLETENGSQNEGVRLALYFQRKAPTIASAYSILADKALLQVAQTALGIPSSASKQSIDKQAKDITARIAIADLKNPAKLQKFIQRFAVEYDLQNADQNPPVTALSSFSPVSGGISIGTDLLMQLQSFRLGR